MYAFLRRYEGINPGDVDEVFRRVNDGFVPILEQTRGFRGYWAIRADEGVIASVTLFDDRSGAEESQQKAAGFVREHLAALLPNPPQITSGEAVVARVGVQDGTPVPLG